MAGVLIRRENGDTERRRPCDDGSRDWSDASSSQGTPRMTGNYEKLGERQRGILLVEPSKRVWTC